MNTASGAVFEDRNSLLRDHNADCDTLKYAARAGCDVSAVSDGDDEDADADRSSCQTGKAVPSGVQYGYQRGEAFL